MRRDPDSPKWRSRWENLADVGEAIKGLALSRNRPIVQTVQFNRQKKSTETGDDLDKCSWSRIR